MSYKEYLNSYEVFKNLIIYRCSIWNDQVDTYFRYNRKYQLLENILSALHPLISIYLLSNFQNLRIYSFPYIDRNYSLRYTLPVYLWKQYSSEFYAYSLMYLRDREIQKWEKYSKKVLPSFFSSLKFTLYFVYLWCEWGCDNEKTLDTSIF